MSEVAIGNVFGPTDDRVAVRGNTSLPYAALVAFRVRNSAGQTGRCTGTLIGKNTILTAAHCFVKSDRNPAFHHISEMFPGADHADEEEESDEHPYGHDPYPFGAWGFNDACAVEHLPNYGAVIDLHEDYAVVDISACPTSTFYRVDCCSTYNTAYRNDFKTLPVVANLSIPSNGVPATFAGYPAAMPSGSPYGAYWPQMFVHYGSPSARLVRRNYTNEPYLLSFQMDATSGQSGSPLLYDTGGGNLAVFGIFRGYNLLDNVARYVDSDVLAFIQAKSVDL